MGRKFHTGKPRSKRLPGVELLTLLTIRLGKTTRVEPLGTSRDSAEAEPVDTFTLRRDPSTQTKSEQKTAKFTSVDNNATRVVATILGQDTTSDISEKNT